MPIPVKCHACGFSGTVPDPFAGKTVKCRQCGARVPFAYALSELALALSFVFAYRLFGFSLELPFFLAALIVLLFIVL